MSCATILSPVVCSAADSFKSFTRYAEQVQADWHVPGMAIAIVDNGQVVYINGFGKRDIKGSSVTANTIFDIASLSKSFTAALLAMQIDDGTYHWQTKIVRLYPQFKLYDPTITQKFEVQDLLAQDSGLPEDAVSNMGNFGYSIDQVIYALRFIKPVAPFRTEFAYQNIFPMLAGEIIQKTSNQSYAAVLHHRLFSPLQMNDSYMDTEDKLYELRNVAQPFAYVAGQQYAYPMNPLYLAKLREHFNAAGGSGGIHSSVADMAKWLIFNMNNGAIEGKQLISLKNMHFIYAPQIPITATTAEVSLNGESEQAYGQGWFIDTQAYKPYAVLYHSGGGTGMHALMAYVPEKKIGVIILTNTWGNKVPEVLYRRFLDLYFNKAPLKDWNKFYLQEQATDVINEKETARIEPCQNNKVPDLEKYVGTYYNPVYGDLVLSKQEDHLEIKIGPMAVIWELRPCRNNVFHAYWPNPYGMKFSMLSNEQGLIEFVDDPTNVIYEMTIPYLNNDGSGIFIKKRD